MYNPRHVHQRKSLKRYVNEQMKKSLVTGVPEIASSASGYRRAVKSVMFLLCTAGFSYQSYVFLDSFLKYETVQNMRIEYPTKFPAPAVSFCSKNRINRKRFCTGLPEECFWYNKTVDFCNAHPKLCKRWLKWPSVLGVPHNISRTHNLSNEFLDAYGPQSPLEFFPKMTHLCCCQLKINGGIETCNVNDSMLLQVPSNGLPYKCFTMYSLFDKPNEDPRTFRLNDGYYFRINTHLEEYMENKGNLPFYMHVHDPRRIANPLTEGISLKPGYAYIFSFKMKRRQTLPPPYDTNCIDYVTKWKDNGGRGPITKKDCIELCKIERMIEQHNCVGKSITYPHRFPICSKIVTISDKVVEECSSSCREACDDILYTIAVKNENLAADEKLHFDHLIKVSLKFRQLNMQRMYMEPKFQDIELFSYIGGFMGLWLGISFVTFVDFLETVTDVIAFAAKKWKNMHGKKNTLYTFSY